MENRQQEAVNVHKAEEKKVGFDPVTLQRPMRLFKGALSPTRTFDVPFEPDIDFLVRLVTDYRSHQALIRKSAGNQFKNLENLLRQRNQSSKGTIELISRAIEVKPEEIQAWAHGDEDGPLLPQLLQMFALLESVPSQFTAQALDIEVPCPCCKANILGDRDIFWHSQSILFEPPEFRFAERLLMAVIGANALFMLWIRLTDEANEVDWPHLYDLARPNHHPIGNWLAEIQVALGANSLSDLAEKMQLMGTPECNVPYERLKKWSSGMDLMPINVAKALCTEAGSHNKYWVSFFLARAIAFVIDFLVAATTEDAPKRVDVQSIVHHRLMGLGDNIKIAFAERAKSG